MTSATPAGAAAPGGRRAGPAHAPERTCAGCGTKRSKAGLLRVAAAADGLRLDLSSSLGGRGAYLCAATPVECLERARRTRHLARTLRADHGVIDYSELLLQIERRPGAEESPPSPPR